MKTVLTLVGCLFIVLISTTTLGEMYKHIDKDGVTTYSDKEEVGSTLVAPMPSNTIELPKYTPAKIKNQAYGSLLQRIFDPITKK